MRPERHRVHGTADCQRTKASATKSKTKSGNTFRIAKTECSTASVDADNVPELVELFNSFKPELVINVALPYQDLTIMDACLEAGVHYLDTANYEPRDVAKFEYTLAVGLPGALREGRPHGPARLRLRSRRDQRVLRLRTQAPLRQDPHLDIVDCNAADHGKAFATNFNPEINIREITANGRYWENGEWVETKPLEIAQDFDYPDVGDPQEPTALSRGAGVAGQATSRPSSAPASG